MDRGLRTTPCESVNAGLPAFLKGDNSRQSLSSRKWGSVAENKGYELEIIRDKFVCFARNNGETSYFNDWTDPNGNDIEDGPERLGIDAAGPIGFKSYAATIPGGFG